MIAGQPFTGLEPVMISTPLRPWTNDVSLRRYSAHSQWAPFVGLGLRWHHLDAGDSQVQWSGRRGVVANSFTDNQWEGLLMSGLRFQLAHNYYLELEGELRGLKPVRQSFKLQPQLGAEMLWQF